MPTLSSSPALLLLLLLASLRHAEALQLGQTCILTQSKCDAGLHCDNCLATGDIKPTCTRIKPVDPKTKGKGLPFNRYSWLTTHNAFARLGQKSFTGKPIVTLFNQQDTITQQLQNGVRGLMLDLYDFRNDIWLCHSFNRTCYDATAFQPAINIMKEIQAFLEANPEEIVTLIIEDYVTSPQGLTKLFDSAGLRKYWFPVNRMPRNGGDWPTVAAMIAANQRLVVFTSKAAKEASEGIAYEWRYVVENQYGSDGMKKGSCPRRAESQQMNDTTRSLVLVNFFPSIPNPAGACKHNSQSLLDMLDTCQNASRGRWANFIAVDFYKSSNGGGAALATDVANGHLVCGCDDIANCVLNGQFNQCLKKSGTKGLLSDTIWALLLAISLLVEMVFL